jgi:hypothetical protein
MDRPPLARARKDPLRKYTGREFANLTEGVEDFWVATDAYIYGYALVTMEMTRRVMTNVAAAQDNRGPMGQFVRHGSTQALPSAT